MKQALKESELENRKLESEKQSHYKKLQQILDKNELELVNVPLDGNCFMSATLLQLNNLVSDNNTLRNQICDSLLKQKDQYLPFCAIESSNYEAEVAKLRQPNAWDTLLSDMLPMVTANLFGRPAILFSSREGNELCIVETDNTQADSRGEPLRYCYLAVPGIEHYDYCTVKKGELNITSR